MIENGNMHEYYDKIRFIKINNKILLVSTILAITYTSIIITQIMI